MPLQKITPKKTEKAYHVEFSLTSLFFWGLGLFFLLAWIFVLGILVGRGFLPEGVKALSKLSTPIGKLQEIMSNKRKSPDLDLIKMLDKDPKFQFYDELSAKKEEVTKNNYPDEKRAGEQTKLDKGLELSETGEEYTVQIASLNNKIRAVQITDRLSKCGYPAYFYKVNIEGKTYFRVRCGRFKSSKEAGDFKKLLAERERIKGFVTKFEE